MTLVQKIHHAEHGVILTLLTIAFMQRRENAHLREENKESVERSNSIAQAVLSGLRLNLDPSSMTDEQRNTLSSQLGRRRR